MPRLQPRASAAPSPGLYLGKGPAGRCWRALRLRRFRFSSASVSPAKRWRSGSPPNGLARCGRSAAQRRDWRRLRAPPPPAAAAAPAPLRPPSRGRRSRSPAARTAAAAAAAGRAAGGMRHDPTPGFSMLLFGVSLACYSPSLKSVQDQAYTAAVVLEGKVQSVSPPAGNSSGRDPPGSNGGVLVKVLDLWPLNSGGLQREQLISVGSAGSKAPCFKVKRNHRYIFFLEPTEKPLVFKTSFAPLDTSGKNLKKDVGRILCADCDMGGIPARSCPLLLQRERASWRFNFPEES
uniref:Neuregulin 2 N-terminal domain-containing protein n=1 Tax=Crocodylus porosus TaxID=8502 RepID=A0A7M4DXF8_CROPO